MSAGCSVDLSQTTQQTDAAVYEIIDRQWDDDLGTKANYHISDASPEPNSLQVMEVSPPEFGVLTMPQAVAFATGHNRQYHTEKENLYLTALDFTDVRHFYEPMPFIGADGGYFKDGDKKATAGNANFGFEQLLATGAQVGSNISLGWIDILSGDYRSGFSTVASAVITQPLMRGAGRKVALENLTQAERNTLYQIRAFNRYRKEFVTSIMSEYYLVLQLNDRQSNTRNHFYALVDTYENLRKRAVAGRLPQHELEQANQDKLDAFSEYIQAQKEYKNALDEFKLQLALHPAEDFQLDRGEFDALKESVWKPIRISEEEAAKIALDQRLDLANAADMAIDAERKVDVAADAIRAELNLIGIADTQTLDSRTTSEYYELSLQLDLPIDRLTEKNAYRRALIVLMQQQRGHQELTDRVVLEVRRSYREMREAYQRYKNEQNAHQLAQERTKNTQLLLRYDRANTRDVLDAREDLLKAQNAATSALLDYAVASLEFFRDTGVMKVKPDGMWEQSMPPQINMTAAKSAEPYVAQ
ncbi:MAG: TolC family protein [Planctomycetes bacterium]|nr:TolC family protein [Planctomycetota bacterium]